MDVLTFIKAAVTVAAAWLLAFVTPIAGFLALLTALVTADFLTGTRAARVRGEAITSKGYRRTVEKFLFYAIAILLAEGMEHVFFGQSHYLPLTYIVSAFICVTEFKSNLENIGTITGTNPWLAVRAHLERFLTPKA